MIDYLDEDPLISSQQYFVLSYLLGKNNNPMIKVRGSYRTMEECQARIKKLQENDQHFHMFVCEVGKWGSLLTDKEIENNTEIEQNYREEKMNEMMKNYKESREKANIAFEERKNRMKKQAEFEASKEGQIKLANQKENACVVRQRMNILQTQIDEMKNQMVELKEQMRESLTLLQESKELYEKYSEDDILKAEKEFKEYQEKLKNGNI